MEFPKLEVSVRSQSGKGTARRLRAKGLAPAVLYGKGLETLSLTVEPMSLVKALAGDLRMNTIVTLNLTNAAKDQPEEFTVMVRDHQFDPVTRQLWHVDFYAVDATQKIRFEVPFETSGRSVGEQAGGVLSMVYRTLPVFCLPEDLPARITVDISELDINESISVSELVLPGTTEVDLPGDSTVVAVITPKAEPVEEEEVEEGEEGEGEEGEGEAKADGDAKGDDDAKADGAEKSEDKSK